MTFFLFSPFHMHQCTTGRAASDWSDWELGLRHPLGMCSSIPETSAAGSQGTKLQQSHSPGTWVCSQPLFCQGMVEVAPARPRNLGSLGIHGNEHWQEICSQPGRGVRGAERGRERCWQERELLTFTSRQL